MQRLLLLLVTATTACTTLGPTPVTTGVSAVPTQRPGVELAAGLMPAFYLSDSAAERSGAGGAVAQSSVLIEPDRLLHTKGLVLGARRFGDGGDTAIEPMIGYRRRLDGNFSVLGLAYGGRAGAEADGASYSATRLGGELTVDAAVPQINSWFAVHAFLSASGTYLDANGTYCVDGEGDAIDCEQTSRRVDASVEGIYVAGTGGLALDFARRATGALHDIRLAMLGSVGVMPKLVDGVQQPSKDGFYSLGLQLQVGFGAPE